LGLSKHPVKQRHTEAGNQKRPIILFQQLKSGGREQNTIDMQSVRGKPVSQKANLPANLVILTGFRKYPPQMSYDNQAHMKNGTRK
jgi:hypothetical protein